jgi:Fe-S cluster biogenesis protein NfuA
MTVPSWTSSLADSVWSKKMDDLAFQEKVKRVLDGVRPFLQADGGDVEYLRFRAESGVLEVRWDGTCRICPMSKLTLRAGVERALMKELPEVRRVEAVGE